MSAQPAGIQPRMSQREIQVPPDRFEVTTEDVLLTSELDSALAVCVYDAEEQAGALLHLRCIVRAARPADVTDTTLATEMLLLDRCLAALRETMPAARHLQARIVAHLADAPQAQPYCDTMLAMARHYLADAGVRLLPDDIAPGVPRTLRFRPAMGWVHTRV